MATTTEKKDSLAIDLKIVRDHVSRLCALHTQKQLASAEFSGQCKIVAERAGIKPVVLSQYINAVANDKTSEAKAKVEQFSLLFGD